MLCFCPSAQTTFSITERQVVPRTYECSRMTRSSIALIASPHLNPSYYVQMHFQTRPGYYASLLGLPKFPRDDVTVSGIMAYKIFGKAYTKFNMVTEANHDDYAFGVEFWNLAQELLSARKLKTHPIQVEQGGLNGILRGLDLMRQGKVSAKKLVCRIAQP